MVSRMCSDWDASSDKLRKALGFRDALLLHTACGMYLHFMDQFQARCPAAEFPTLQPKLEEMFLAGCLDHELRQAAEHSVYPGDVSKIGSFKQLGFLFQSWCQKGHILTSYV